MVLRKKRKEREEKERVGKKKWLFITHVKHKNQCTRCTKDENMKHRKTIKCLKDNVRIISRSQGREEYAKQHIKKANQKVKDWFILKLIFPGGSVVKNSLANAGDTGSIPGSGRSPGKGNGNPF